ncbi:MAG: hypothetical protein E7022_03330 [Desulfovibrio desulfuricans]|nr:hypothetical protein [Desulfovibrio desulfuricans]
MRERISPIILVCLIVFLSFISISSNAKAEQVGPSIKGLRLGMSLNEFKLAAEKLGLVYVDYNYYDCFIDKEKYNKYKNQVLPTELSAIRAIHDRKTNSIIHIEFYDLELLFNAKGTRKGFIQKFINNFKIPRLVAKNKGNIIYFTYSDTKNGWGINIYQSQDIECIAIELDSIEKETGDFNFN